MIIKFSKDLVPLTGLKVNPGRVVKHITEKNRRGGRPHLGASFATTTGSSGPKKPVSHT